MVAFRLRAQERQDAPVSYAWDTVWSDTELTFDWQLIGTTPQTLVAMQELNTSIVIQLATWRRAAPGDPIDDDDPNGWWADQFCDPSADEGPIGSRLWLLYRQPLTEQTRSNAVLYAQEAMQTFIDQGVFVSVSITADIDKLRSLLVLTVKGFGQNGTMKYAQKFGRVWQQEFSSEGITSAV